MEAGPGDDHTPDATIQSLISQAALASGGLANALLDALGEAGDPHYIKLGRMKLIIHTASLPSGSATLVAGDGLWDKSPRPGRSFASEMSMRGTFLTYADTDNAYQSSGDTVQSCMDGFSQAASKYQSYPAELFSDKRSDYSTGQAAPAVEPQMWLGIELEVLTNSNEEGGVSEIWTPLKVSMIENVSLAAWKLITGSWVDLTASENLHTPHEERPHLPTVRIGYVGSGEREQGSVWNVRSSFQRDSAQSAISPTGLCR